MSEPAPEVEISGEDPKSRFERRLFSIFDSYIDQIQAISDILVATTPHASILDAPEAVTAQVRQALKGVPSSDIKKVSALFREKWTEEFDPELFVAALLDEFREAWAYDLVSALYQSFQRPRRLPILRNSLLTTAVSLYEVLLANVVTEFFRFKPPALGMNSRDKEKEFSLRDILQFTSMNDAVEFFISRRVENLMFGSLSDWRKFFDDAFRIDISTLCMDWTNFQELIQRRHVIVHNMARASRRYITQMQQIAPAVKVEEGDNLSCDNAYLENAIDELLVAGTLLVVAVSEKFKFDEPDLVQSGFADLSYKTLVAGRFTATKKMCEYGKNMALSQSYQFVFNVNLMLAIKALNGAAAIKEEVEMWDVSALSNLLRLARECLIGNLDSAFELLGPLVDREEISTENLLEWPLLADIRDDPRFESVIASKLKLGELERLHSSNVVYNRARKTVHTASCKFKGASEPASRTWPEVKAARRCRHCEPTI